jgi:hypothetical protein
MAYLHSLGIPVMYDVLGVGQNLCDHPGVHVRWHVEPIFGLPPEEVGRKKVALRSTARGATLRMTWLW